jgi:HSP20 family molecular chaperone IbpA
MTRMAGFSSPLLLGFDEIERVLDRAAKTASDGYPPYNIERVRNSDSGAETLRIIMAVAGFSEDALEITIENNHLTIRGRQIEEPERDFLHRGIAARPFQRSFVLEAGIEITGAELKNGLLSVNLTKKEPERTVRTIKIGLEA